MGESMKINRIVVVPIMFFILLLPVLLPFVVTDGDVLTKKLTAGLEIVATLVAAGGLLGLFIQFMRERDLAEADFTLRLNQNFLTNEHLFRIYKILEASKESKQQEDPFSEEDLIDMANYLSFFGPLWGLIERGLVKIEFIDVLAYRFFLATNNRFMQEKLLCRKEEDKHKAWLAIYHLHKAWRAYRKDNDLPVWQEDSGLSKTSPYKEMITAASQKRR
jgi:hypothetical protein